MVERVVLRIGTKMEARMEARMGARMGARMAERIGARQARAMTHSAKAMARATAPHIEVRNATSTRSGHLHVATTVNTVNMCTDGTLVEHDCMVLAPAIKIHQMFSHIHDIHIP